MGKRLTLHLQQNTNLERVATILDFFTNQNQDIDKLSERCGLGLSVLQKAVFPFLRSIAILSKKNPPELTALGKVAAALYQSNPDLLGDFLHLVIYNLHQQEPDKRFSWVYATVAQQMWLRKEVLLSPIEKKSLVQEVIEASSHRFNLPTGEIAFSSSSMTGVLNWLRSLEPPVLESIGKSERFTRRYFCAAPVFIKAVDLLYQQLDRADSYGSHIILREDIQERLCQMLLLDPSGLDNTLENTKRTYDYDRGGVFDWGYEGGHGQWVMLTKSPEWGELLS
jgi:hypothetical protein